MMMTQLSNLNEITDADISGRNGGPIISKVHENKGASELSGENWRRKAAAMAMLATDKTSCVIIVFMRLRTYC